MGQPGQPVSHPWQGAIPATGVSALIRIPIPGTANLVLSVRPPAGFHGSTCTLFFMGKGSKIRPSTGALRRDTLRDETPHPPPVARRPPPQHTTRAGHHHPTPSTVCEILDTGWSVQQQAILVLEPAPSIPSGPVLQTLGTEWNWTAFTFPPPALAVVAPGSDGDYILIAAPTQARLTPVLDSILDAFRASGFTVHP